MARTIKDGLVFDVATRVLVYRCSCGQNVRLEIRDLVPDQAIDYHGCGGACLTFTAALVADYRRAAGLAKLGE